MWKHIQEVSRSEIVKMIEPPKVETPKQPRMHREWRKGSAVSLLSQAKAVAANRANLRGTEAREEFCKQSNITLHDLSMLTRVGLDARLFKMRDQLPSKFHLIYKLSLLPDAQLEALKPKIYPGMSNRECEEAMAAVARVETVVIPAKPVAPAAPKRLADKSSSVVRIYKNAKSASAQLRIPMHIAKLIPDEQHFEVSIDENGVHFKPCAAPEKVEDEVPSWCKS